MDSQPGGHSDRHGLDAVFTAIAVWVMKYRFALGKRKEAVKCAPEDVARVARDMHVAPGELAALATKGPNSAALLEKMLRALGVEPGQLADANPLIMRDLERLCIACVAQRQCAHELAEGTAAKNFRDFCPNAFALEPLLKGK